MGFQTYIYLNKSTLTSYLRIVYCICCTEDAPFYTRDLRISRRVELFDKSNGRGQGGGKERGEGPGNWTENCTDRIIITRLEELEPDQKQVSLSQCNIALESITYNNRNKYNNNNNNVVHLKRNDTNRRKRNNIVRELRQHIDHTRNTIHTLRISLIIPRFRLSIIYSFFFLSFTAKYVLLTAA